MGEFGANFGEERDVPSSTVRTFTDPDAYAASIRGAEARMTVTAPGDFLATLIRVDLHDLCMQRLSDNLPRVTHFSDFTKRVVVAFRSRPGPIVLLNGTELSDVNIAPVSTADVAVTRSRGSCSVSTLSLPVEALAEGGAVLAGRPLTSLNNMSVLTPLSPAFERLRRLHATAMQLAEDAPAVLAQPDAAHGFEQAMIEAFAACLSDGETREETAALRQHAAIMRRFHRALERHLDQPLYIPELCAEIGTSERTLRVCCQEQLGTSPKRYLLLRRMNLARGALRDSTPLETTVTEIATRFGFWQFGRFASEYKALFGESPSIALARPPEYRKPCGPGHGA